MTHAPPVLCCNTAVLRNALEQFPPHPQQFPARTALLPGEHPCQKAMLSSGLLRPAEKDPRLFQPCKKAVAPSLPVWVHAYSLLQTLQQNFIFFFFVTVYCETVKQCWKQETRYPCFLLLLPLCGWTVQNISNFCISRLICSSIPGSCIFHLVLQNKYL